MLCSGPADTPTPSTGFEQRPPAWQVLLKHQFKQLGGRKNAILTAATSPVSPAWAAWGHSPADALLGVVEQDADDVQEARQQLQGEVEEPDPQACGGGQQGWDSIPEHPQTAWVPCACWAAPQHSPAMQPHSTAQQCSPTAQEPSDPRGLQEPQVSSSAQLHVSCPVSQTQPTQP